VKILNEFKTLAVKASVIDRAVGVSVSTAFGIAAGFILLGETVHKSLILFNIFKHFLREIYPQMRKMSFWVRRARQGADHARCWAYIQWLGLRLG
jgi:hypothetical protein